MSRPSLHRDHAGERVRYDLHKIVRYYDIQSVNHRICYLSKLVNKQSAHHRFKTDEGEGWSSNSEVNGRPGEGPGHDRSGPCLRPQPEEPTWGGRFRASPFCARPQSRYGESRRPPCTLVGSDDDRPRGAAAARRDLDLTGTTLAALDREACRWGVFRWSS